MSWFRNDEKEGEGERINAWEIKRRIELMESAGVETFPETVVDSVRFSDECSREDGRIF